MTLLDKPDSSNIRCQPPASPAWYTAMLALPEDVQSEIKVNAVILRRAVKDKHVPLGESAALELVARLYVGLMTPKAAR